MGKGIWLMPVALLLLAWTCGPAAMGFVEEFDYADPNDFEAAWSVPVLGGSPATSFSYTTGGGRLLAQSLDDSTDSDGLLGTATFSQAVSWSGDFFFTADVSWAFLDTLVSNSNAHLFLEVRDSAGVIGSCGMMDDWIGVGAAPEIAAWGQVGGPDSLYINDTTGGASNPVTNGLGAIATSWMQWNTPWGAVLYVPHWDHRWYEDGSTRLAIQRRGDEIGIYMIKGGEIMELVTAQGSTADVTEIVIKFANGAYEGAGYPNPTMDMDSLAIDRLELSIPPISLVETDGSTAVAEGGATDSYSIVLNEAPLADIDVLVSSDPNDQFHVSLNGGSPEAPVTLTFTPANWATPQVVTVEAVDDSKLELEHFCVIRHAVVGADPSSQFAIAPIPDVLVTITDNEALSWEGEPLVEEFDYTDETDPAFLANWGEPVLGGYSAESFDFAVTDGRLIGLELVDSTPYGSEQGLATATFTRVLPEAFTGDFRVRANLSWSFINGQSNGVLFVEARGGGQILGSFGMYDDWIGADSREIAGYAQIGGTETLHQDNRTTGGADPRTTVGAVATSLADIGGWHPPLAHRFIGDGETQFQIERTGTLYRIYMVRDGAMVLLVQANGTPDPVEELRIKYLVADFSDIGYPNADDNVNNLAVESLTLRRRVLSVIESNGGTAVQEGNGPDSYEIVLDREPSSAVVVTAAPADVNIALNGAAAGEAITLTFEPETWDQAQTVMVGAVDDDVLEYDQVSQISHEASSADAAFNLGYGPTVTVQIADNDCGLWGFLMLDLNQDCYVNLVDLALMAGSWLDCTVPYESGCDNLLAP